jgi:hypothetical protein
MRLHPPSTNFFASRFHLAVATRFNNLPMAATTEAQIKIVQVFKQ